MNPDRKQTENSDKKETDVTPKKVDAIETPPPPQHMDPSKKPATEKTDSKSGKKTRK